MAKKAQVWVETVMYTLIGLTLIGILLGISRPKIDEMKDKLVIEQIIDSLTKVNGRIHEIQTAPGNRRVVDLKVSKGAFFINSSGDQIGWFLDSNYKYSEIGEAISMGSMKVITKKGNPYTIYFYLDYGVDLEYNENELEGYVEFQESPTAYSISMENTGELNSEGILKINLVAL